MNDSALTLDRMRADVASLLDEDAEAVQPGVNLLDLGMDSLRIMELVERWSAETTRGVDFASLAEEPDIGVWWRLVSGPEG